RMGFLRAKLESAFDALSGDCPGLFGIEAKDLAPSLRCWRGQGLEAGEHLCDRRDAEAIDCSCRFNVFRDACNIVGNPVERVARHTVRLSREIEIQRDASVARFWSARSRGAVEPRLDVRRDHRTARAQKIKLSLQTRQSL